MKCGCSRFLRGLTLLACAAILAGCAASADEKQHYILEPRCRGAPVPSPRAGSLEVRRLSAGPAFATKAFVYRLADSQYESDYYHEFFVSPALMITENTRAWLTESGLFERILPAGSRIAPDYSLEGSITALYGDFSDASEPQAVLAIRFFLLQDAEAAEAVFFSKAYRTATPVPQRTSESFVTALTRSLEDILTRLENDLAESLAGRRS